VAGDLVKRIVLPPCMLNVNTDASPAKMACVPFP
jgi:hypothetical protein